MIARARVLVSVAAVGFCAAGCCSTPPIPERLTYASGVVEQPPIGLDSPQWRRPAGGAREGPRVVARFRFIACESAALEGLEIDLREPARVIPPDAMETFLNQLESTDGIETLEAGAMKLVSGRREYALVIDESAYIRDYAMTAPGEDGGFSLRPVIGSVRTGLMLGLVADVKGEGIELSHLEPKIAGHLGTRLCRAEAIVPGGVCHLLWEEPVLLVARADDGLPARITIEDGHSLLIPLRLQVKQGTANARGYARGGRVQERYVQKPGTGEDESALARDHFVLLSVNSG